MCFDFGKQIQWTLYATDTFGTVSVCPHCRSIRSTELVVTITNIQSKSMYVMTQKILYIIRVQKVQLYLLMEWSSHITITFLITNK